MEVLLARQAGFCFGVKRAINLAQKTAECGPASTYGPLIHNPQVVENLEKQGLNIVEELEDSRGKLIIRSHGVAPEVYEKGKELSLELVDATCPFVQRAQRQAMESQETGRQVIVVGDPKHPEVKGIIGWTGQRGIVVENADQARELPPLGPLAVLAQTTQPQQNFREIVDILRSKNPDVIEYNTICSATGERQEAALELAGQVEVMVVVGGKESANTKKLANICASVGTPTYQVETAQDLEADWFRGVKRAGLTAGASTPDWIIEEVFSKMTELNLPAGESNNDEIEDMASWEMSLQDVNRGNIVTGTVVRISADEVLVDIGGKSEGIIPLRELAVKTPSHPSEVLQVGDEVKAMVLRAENEEGNPVLSKRRADQLEAVDKLQEAFQQGSEIQAPVVGVVKGGLLVDVGMRGFVPASQIQRGFVQELEQFVGKTLRLRILDLDVQKNKLVLSQKVILEEEAGKAREALWQDLAEGQVVKGVVRRLANFGAFVDIGGLDALLHVSDMSYGRVKHPSEIVKEGDEIEAQVLKVDREKQKVSLGLKQIMPSPWEDAANKFAVGSIVGGKVVRIAPFGAFVQLAEGIDGLIHISQLSERRVAKPEEVVQVGQEVQAKVIEFRPADKRISLSLKEAKTELENKETAEFAPKEEGLGATIGDAVGHPVEESGE